LHEAEHGLDAGEVDGPALGVGDSVCRSLPRANADGLDIADGEPAGRN
jgi:hypothetical protein